MNLFEGNESEDSSTVIEPSDNDNSDGGSTDDSYYNTDGDGYSTDDSYNNSDDDYIDNIYYTDREFVGSDKESGKYYIGSCEIISNPSTGYYLLMRIAVSKITFFKFPFTHINKYLCWFNIAERDDRFNFQWNYYIKWTRVNILKLYIINDVYTVVIKTFWIRIIQRNWKRIYKKRQEIIKKRKRLDSLQHREITGRFPYGLNVLPSFHGMLYGV